jgi:hypothetical protein
MPILGHWSNQISNRLGKRIHHHRAHQPRILPNLRGKVKKRRDDADGISGLQVHDFSLSNEMSVRRDGNYRLVYQTARPIDEQMSVFEKLNVRRKFHLFICSAYALEIDSSLQERTVQFVLVREAGLPEVVL